MIKKVALAGYVFTLTVMDSPYSDKVDHLEVWASSLDGVKGVGPEFFIGKEVHLKHENNKSS